MSRIRLSGLENRRSGFTVVEMVISLGLGLLVLGTAITFLTTQLRTLEGNDVRENVVRNGRYVGVALRRDVQRAGVLLESTTSFGSVAAWSGSPGDTLVMLYVPYETAAAPPHSIDPPAGSDNPLAPGGTCGPRCIDVFKTAGVPLELGVGDLARLQVNGTRRLVIIEDITVSNDTSVALTWTAADTILRVPAGLSGGLQLDRFNTYVQKLTPVVYYLDDQERLRRSVGLNLNGSLDGDVLAYGVESFDVKLVFADGDLLDQADPNDADVTNDFDDIVGVRVRATFKADRIDPRVNQGQLLRRTYTWEASPRNLRYEKNRS